MGKLLELLSLLSHPVHHCVIVGDFNSPHINWSKLSSFDKPCGKLLSFITSNGFSQHVTSPTRHNPDSMLDLVLAKSSTIWDLKVGELFSDHRLIHISLAISKSTKLEVKKVLCFKKADYKIINHFLACINWTTLFKDLNVEEMYQKLHMQNDSFVD
uniref:Endo/exonuclease/phosphatase domain-containing protein n=1 Tax=Caenorhabditis japonica TaxID=281687 RepID=A0A8R1I6S9_CAEJA